MRWVLASFLLLVCGCTQGDGRSEEVWAVDFLTYESEVVETMADLGIDPVEVENLALDYLADYFADLPIRFEAGSALGSSSMSSICVRHGSSTKVGRGILDINNTHVVHDCGEPDGTEHGAFVDRLALILRPQLTSFNYTTQQRANLFARVLAMVLAHEIGHGVGLEHSTADYGPGDIMKAAPVFDINQVYYFNVPHRELLAVNLAFGG